MNIEHLKLFLRLSVTKNISQAGADFGLSPAVAGAHITRLEESLGVRLVHRTTRMVSLTEDGVAFLPYADDVVARVEAARGAVNANDYVPQGNLRVTAPASFGTMHLMKGLQGFQERYGNLRVDFRFSDAIVDMVEGGYDIAIRNATLQDSTLIARRLAPDQRIVCAAPSYLKRAGCPTHPSELAKHQCINLYGLEQWQFKIGMGKESVKTSGLFTSDNGIAVRDACASGAGIALTSTWCSYELIQSGDLVVILKDFPVASDAAIWAVYPTARLVPPKVRAFIAYFSEFFGEQPYWDASLFAHL